jgi:peptidoglycan-associated lipoprotein
MNRISTKQATRLVLTLLAALVLGIAGCASDSEKAAPEAPDTGSEFSDAGATAPPPEPVEEAPVAQVEFSSPPVYFAFDSSELDMKAQDKLRAAAKLLNETGVSVVLSGHCDERGSEEYNLALGERRAEAVRRYLRNLNVPARQMTIVSYGEIRPAVQGHTEAAWALNRRVEFEPTD